MILKKELAKLKYFTVNKFELKACGIVSNYLVHI